MKLLLELKDDDIGVRPRKIKTEIRSAARAVIFSGNKIALIHVTKNNYHKLPGGGIEKGETVKGALVREIAEETGCKIKITREVGKVIEHRSHEGIVMRNAGLLQTSYCYLADVMEKGKTNFDEGEKEAGYKLEWTSLASAIKIIENSKPNNYEGKFIVRRDLALLKAAKAIAETEWRKA